MSPSSDPDLSASPRGPAPFGLSPQRLRFALLGLLGFGPSLLWVADQWTSQPLDFSLPGPLVLGLVLLLALREGARPRPAGGLRLDDAAAWLAPLAGMAGVLAAALSLGGRPFGAVFLLPPAVALAIAAIWGPRAARVHLGLLGLLWLVPPWPMPLRTALQEQLSLWGAAWSAQLARVLGLAVQRDGIVVWTDQFFIRVIDSCSGLYMILMFLVVAGAFVHLRGLRGLRALRVALLAPALGLLLNTLRLVLILWGGHHWPERFQGDMGADSLSHDLPGLLLFGLGVLVLALAAGRKPAEPGPLSAAADASATAAPPADAAPDAPAVPPEGPEGAPSAEDPDSSTTR